MSTALLEARGLSAGYGGVAAIEGIDLEVGPGEVVALLGANGAGKTTTMLSLCGELPAMTGEVRWLGQPARGPLTRRAREGLALITEERSVFTGLTAAENLKLGRGSSARAIELFPELEEHLRRRAGLLSGGQQQILTVARALAAKPRVLLADELSLGLAPLVVARLLSAVREAADRDGVGVLLVEQHVRDALAIADRVYVIRRGRIVLRGSGTEMAGQIDRIEGSYLSGPIG
jgi:branched-chain amino acid transport system ATP-binding protein